MISIRKVTPVLIVDAIEPCLAYWVDTLGYEKTVEVPHEGKLGFVILVHRTVAGGELMLQTLASLRDDLPAALPYAPVGSTILYAEVSSLAAARATLANVPTLVAFRETPYGAQETVTLSPGGQVTIFAVHQK